MWPRMNVSESTGKYGVTMQIVGCSGEISCILSTDLPAPHRNHRMRIFIVDMKLVLAHYLVELSLAATISMKLNGY